MECLHQMGILKESSGLHQMYPARPGLVTGFHGCDLRVCDKVIQGKTELKPSNNTYDWLGSGIYFWENNRQRALEFATDLKNNTSRKSKIKQPAVVGAILDLGICLDLLDAKYINLVKESYENFFTCCRTLNLPLPENRKVGNSLDLLLRDLDCAVINNIQQNEDSQYFNFFDSVRAAFIEGAPLYESAGFYEKTHIQLCICNPNCIKGYFLPLESNKNFSIP